MEALFKDKLLSPIWNCLHSTGWTQTQSQPFSANGPGRPMAGKAFVSTGAEVPPWDQPSWPSKSHRVVLLEELTILKNLGLSRIKNLTFQANRNPIWKIEDSL